MTDSVDAEIRITFRNFVFRLGVGAVVTILALLTPLAVAFALGSGNLSGTPLRSFEFPGGLPFVVGLLICLAWATCGRFSSTKVWAEEGSLVTEVPIVWQWLWVAGETDKIHLDVQSADRGNGLVIRGTSTRTWVPRVCEIKVGADEAEDLKLQLAGEASKEPGPDPAAESSNLFALT